MLWGGELLLRDGAPAGQVTSAAWGETVGASVGLAYLRSDGPVTSDSLSAGRLRGGRRGGAVRRTAVPEGPAGLIQGLLRQRSRFRIRLRGKDQEARAPSARRQ